MSIKLNKKLFPNKQKGKRKKRKKIHKRTGEKQQLESFRKRKRNK